MFWSRILALSNAGTLKLQVSSAERKNIRAAPSNSNTSFVLQRLSPHLSSDETGAQRLFFVDEYSLLSLHQRSLHYEPLRTPSTPATNAALVPLRQTRLRLLQRHERFGNEASNLEGRSNISLEQLSTVAISDTPRLLPTPN